MFLYSVPISAFAIGIFIQLVLVKLNIGHPLRTGFIIGLIMWLLLGASMTYYISSFCTSFTDIEFKTCAASQIIENFTKNYPRLLFAHGIYGLLPASFGLFAGFYLSKHLIRSSKK